MREIGTLKDETQAIRFSDYLLTVGVRSMVEDEDGEWAVWVYDEDRLDEAREELSKFIESPDDARYADVDKAAEDIRKQKQAEDEKARKNIDQASRRLQRGSTPMPGGMGMPTAPGVKRVLIVTALVFLFQNMDQNHLGQSKVDDLMALSFGQLKSGEVWRLVTYGFCHGGMRHFFFNMLTFWFMGRLVEPVLGTREFLTFYFVGIVISGLAQVGHSAFHNIDPGVIGASGGVMAVTFLGAVLYPRQRVFLMGVFPIELRWLAVLIGVMNVFGAGGANIAHTAHLGGAAFGLLYGFYGWRFFRDRGN